MEKYRHSSGEQEMCALARPTDNMSETKFVKGGAAVHEYPEAKEGGRYRHDAEKAVSRETLPVRRLVCR